MKQGTSCFKGCLSFMHLSILVLCLLVRQYRTVKQRRDASRLYDNVVFSLLPVPCLRSPDFRSFLLLLTSAFDPCSLFPVFRLRTSVLSFNFCLLPLLPAPCSLSSVSRLPSFLFTSDFCLCSPFPVPRSTFCIPKS